MYLATTRVHKNSIVAFVVEDRVVSIRDCAAGQGSSIAESLPSTVLGVIEKGPDYWAELESFYDTLRDGEFPSDAQDKWWWTKESVTFEPPLIPRKNPWVVGANYYQHLANGFARIPRPAIAPPHVEYFSKAVNSIIGDNADIVFDKRSTRTVDFELELAVVIGKTGKDVSVADAYDWVFGYTIANDISARELQLGHQQYHRGKSLDGFCPLGPVIATPRETGDPNRLRMRQWLNGELKQDWPVGDMIYKIDKLIEVLSQGMTIEPGEVIICGTVPGVGFEQLPQDWLIHGDLLEAEISRIGMLTNRIKLAGAS
ncbi:fumarylacetoacetate hydrolase family protein [Hyphococcus sp.]|uniref:fumarylacetoacetate hydrolase family protein n=1 Tax=Hyphococcus sp. TaxID=2038636 RepID=UPI003CCBD286